MTTMRLALAQINATVGDLDRNADKIIAFIERGKMVQADLILFPELAVTGYPPEDLCNTFSNNRILSSRSTEN